NGFFPAFRPVVFPPPARLRVRPDAAQPLAHPDAAAPVRAPVPAEKTFGPGAAPAVTDNVPPPPTAAPSIAIEMVGPEIANIGSPVAYELVVHNTGKVAVAHVRVEDELPSGFPYGGGEPKADQPGPRMAWNLGGMEPGTERRIKVVVKAMAEGELRSRATVTFSSACSFSTKFTRPKLAVSVT